jgi:hypothetical protein
MKLKTDTSMKTVLKSPIRAKQFFKFCRRLIIHASVV